MHIFQDLQQSPTLAAIAFGGEGPFAFEINVINQGVAALCGRCDALELSVQIFAITGLGEHFGQGLLQARDEELCLEINRIDKKLAQLFHFR
jgi:hypothetical protein